MSIRRGTVSRLNKTVGGVMGCEWVGGVRWVSVAVIRGEQVHVAKLIRQRGVMSVIVADDGLRCGWPVHALH